MLLVKRLIKGMVMKVYLSIALGALSITVGVLAQRSRMCFVAGFRDYLIVRDRELLLGLFSFLITIWVLTSVLYSVNLLRKGIPEYGDIVVRSIVDQVPVKIMVLKNMRETRILDAASLSSLFNIFVIVTFVGGLVLGLLSTLAGGCVLRQHVLFAQGNMNALFYLLGFYSAVIVYYMLLFRYFVHLY